MRFAVIFSKPSGGYGSVRNTPYPGFAGTSPKGGEDLREQIFPPWGKWPEGP